METIAKNGVNFTKFFNADSVGKKFKFEATEKEGTLVAYFKAHTENNPLGGNQTQVSVKWKGNNKVEHFVTADLRKAHCPEYETKTYASKPKQTFEDAFLALASRANTEEEKFIYKALQEAFTEAKSKYKEDAKTKEIAELEARLAALRAQ